MRLAKAFSLGIGLTLVLCLGSRFSLRWWAARSRAQRAAKLATGGGTSRRRPFKLKSHAQKHARLQDEKEVEAGESEDDEVSVVGSLPLRV